ncbi:hypothetical protein [Mesorhizobium sanjuanii]|nr:hypothetical protein [Mesorhizobium sanjuanii]
MSKIVKIASALAVATVLTVGISTSAKADYCSNVVTDAVNSQLADQYIAQTADIRAVVSMMEAAGKTSSPLYIKLNTALTQTFNEFERQGNEAANQGINDCRSGLAPAQQIVDVAIANLTGGLSLILPPNMTHIDMGEILSGNILGGENSFFRKNLGIKW